MYGLSNDREKVSMEVRYEVMYRPSNIIKN